MTVLLFLTCLSFFLASGCPELAAAAVCPGSAEFAAAAGSLDSPASATICTESDSPAPASICTTADAAAGKPSGRSASTGTDKASVCAAFGRAEVYIDRAEGHYADLHNYLLSRAQGGAQDISEDDWNTMVLPHAKKVVMFTNLAMRELESVMPEKISADFWRNVRYGVYQQWEWGVDVFKKMGFYKSEYMLVFAGYENYLQMYRIIMYSKWEMISNAKDEMLELKKQL